MRGLLPHITLLLALLLPCSMSGSEQPDSVITTNADGKPVEKVVFQDGNVRTMLWNTATNTWQLAALHTTATDSEGRTAITESREYAINGQTAAGERSEYSYSGDENLYIITKNSQRWAADKGCWQDSVKVKAQIEFDSYGRNIVNSTYILKEKESGGEWIPQSEEKFVYGLQGRVQEILCREGDKTYTLAYRYDDEEDEDIHTQYIDKQELIDGSTRKYLCASVTTYLSDSGNEAIIVSQEFDAEGNQLAVNTQTYNYTYGQLQEETQKNATFEIRHSDSLSPIPEPQLVGSKAESARFVNSYDHRDNLSKRLAYKWDNTQNDWLLTSREVYYYPYNDTAIRNPERQHPSATSLIPYNIAGQRVADGHRGVIIQGGKKIVR